MLRSSWVDVHVHGNASRYHDMLRCHWFLHRFLILLLPFIAALCYAIQQNITVDISSFDSFKALSKNKIFANCFFYGKFYVTTVSHWRRLRFWTIQKMCTFKIKVWSSNPSIENRNKNVAFVVECSRKCLIVKICLTIAQGCVWFKTKK